VWISLLFIFYKSIYINKNPCGRNELTMQNDLNELLNNYCLLNNLQRKDLIWYSEAIRKKDL